MEVAEVEMVVTEMIVVEVKEIVVVQRGQWRWQWFEMVEVTDW